MPILPAHAPSDSLDGSSDVSGDPSSEGSGSNSPSSPSEDNGSNSPSSSSEGGGSNLSSSEGSTSISKRSKLSLNFNSGAIGRDATAYSLGGGKPFTLSWNSTFVGREAGGGTRDQVYGTSQYGSGYPYGSSGSYLDNRPLPFVFWPVSIAPHYYGSDAYMDNNGTFRPGGNLTTAIIKGNPNTNEIYRIIGDQFSATAVLDALVRNCTVESTNLTSFDPNVNLYPRAEQIVQWYRASSFGLALDTYNNTVALPSNMPVSNNSAPPLLSAATPLPVGLNMTFLYCLNATIAASVPLVEPMGFFNDTIIGWMVIFSIIIATLIINGRGGSGNCTCTAMNCGSC